MARFLAIAAGALAFTSALAIEPDAKTDEAVTSHIPRDNVESSAIKNVGYSKRKHVLEVEFANGSVYRYINVPPSVYRDLMAAESKTRYYSQYIKGNYVSQRVRRRVKDQSGN